MRVRMKGDDPREAWAGVKCEALLAAGGGRGGESALVTVAEDVRGSVSGFVAVEEEGYCIVYDLGLCVSGTAFGRLGLEVWRSKKLEVEI